MFRIDDPTAAASLPTPETAGTQGYFTEGDPVGGLPATNVRASFLNMLQEELMSLLSAASISGSKTTYNQVLTALRSGGVVINSGSHGASGYIKIPAPVAGQAPLIVQWGSGLTTSGTGVLSVTFPIAFPTALYVMLATSNDTGNTYSNVTSGSLTGASVTCYLPGGSVQTVSKTQFWFAIGK